MISHFGGKYRFLSNFFPCKVEMEGKNYPSVEHAYQAAKTTDPRARIAFQIPSDLTTGQAKRLGQQLDLRSNWENIKIGVMYRLLVSKFSDTNLRLQLQATGEEELIEGNDWGDSFWGVCGGVGENFLGKCLMQVRSTLK